MIKVTLNVSNANLTPVLKTLLTTDPSGLPLKELILDEAFSGKPEDGINLTDLVALDTLEELTLTNLVLDEYTALLELPNLKLLRVAHNRGIGTITYVTVHKLLRDKGVVIHTDSTKFSA